MTMNLRSVVRSCGLAVGIVLLFITIQTPTSHAASAVSYARGYTVQGSWLCYGWTSPAIYHCTQHWGWRNGRPYSFTGFVPNSLPAAGSGMAQSRDTSRVVTGPVAATAATAAAAAAATAGQPCHEAVRFPATIGPWTVPSGCYGGIYRPNPANYVGRPSYGWCNWWPEVLNPRYSGYNALHQPGHAAPRVGAVVFFAPYVQGASSAGHYAQVVAIAPGGYWVLVTEMNFYWRGGGFARVDYRYVHVGWGVTFRY